ncbi:MAG: hypothetical protein S4CHLAM2_15490 [Chlamydiales bacterium]|nr:hypothetical protein [Chlamydiales bacterium]
MKEKIPRRANQCADGKERFLPGSEYVSLLTSTDHGWERTDFCLACWEKANKTREGQYWRGKIPLKIEKRQTPDEKALKLLRTLEEPKLLSVLALYLQRRGQIVRRGEGKGSIYYEIPESGETFALAKITLSPEEGREVGEQLVRLLDESP